MHECFVSGTRIFKSKTPHSSGIHCITYFTRMFLQRAFYISLYIFAVSIAAAPPPNPYFDESHLPSSSLSRDEVQAMREGQTYPPGYSHRYITLGEGSDAASEPIVEADPNILLDDENGVRARSLAARGNCQSRSSIGSTCFITYCWTRVVFD
jgi:hypothetical protein